MPPVAGDTCRLQGIEHTASRVAVRSYPQRELASPLCEGPWGYRLDPTCQDLVQEVVEVGDLLLALLPQRTHPAGSFKHLKRGPDGCHGEDRRVGELPCLDRRNRVEHRVHLKSGGLVGPPPALEPVEVGPFEVALVDETSGGGARTGVEVLVGTPGGEVGSAVVKAQGYVPDGVGEVKADHGTDPVCRVRQVCQRKHLARVVVHPRQQDEGQFIALFGNCRHEVLGVEQVLAGTGRNGNQGLFGRPAVMAYLGSHSEVV